MQLIENSNLETILEEVRESQSQLASVIRQVSHLSGGKDLRASNTFIKYTSCYH